MTTTRHTGFAFVGLALALATGCDPAPGVTPARAAAVNDPPAAKQPPKKAPLPAPNDLPKPVDTTRAEAQVTELRNELTRLDADRKSLTNSLAKEVVEASIIERTIDELKEERSRHKARLVALADAIKNAEGNKDRATPIAEIRTKLETETKRYEANQKSLLAKEELLAQKVQSRNVLEKQLESLRNQKSELAGAVGKVESELGALKLQQLKSPPKADESRLEKVKEDLEKLRKKLDTEREKLKLTEPGLAPAPKTAN